MHNLALTVILADQGRRQCPCGAVADRPLGLCRKCQDRNAWRRKSATHRKTNRRRPSGRTRRVVRFLTNGLEG